jgi:uracil-DNA glycosylase family 4
MTGAERELLRLARGIQRCRACPLHQSRRHAVPGEGPVTARVMLVGEAPGDLEDQEGRPFVGRSGRFLTRVLEEYGFDRRDLFVTSSVKCRPRGNRAPRATELSTCYCRWLARQLGVVDPGVVVLLGQAPVRQVLGDRRALKLLHGDVRSVEGRSYLITYHPAAAMRFPGIAAAMRKDLRKLRGLADAVD